MKIIHNGLQKKCGICHSLMEYSPDDIFVKKIDIKIGHHEIETIPDPDEYYQCYIKCPVCQTNIRVNKDKNKIKEAMQLDNSCTS